MTSLKTSIKTITYLSDIGCLEIQGASLASNTDLILVKIQTDNKMNILNVYVKNV
ncbi:quinol oxidase subunit [Escherichia coli]|nr:quinol oxidase subunit [Escherichia coli]